MGSKTILDKINLLGQSARYDLCCTQHCLAGGSNLARRVRSDIGRWIYPATMPNGETVLLFKVLMSNECVNDCIYCVNRCSNSFRRTGFTPEELTRVFLELNRRGWAKGLFLSSAVADGPDRTMDRMLAAAEILRCRHRFDGFIHLKVLPGASRDRVQRAAELADRISINLEAPNAIRMGAICPDKDFDGDIARRIKWISDLVRRRDTRCKGHTTQFVVGAAGETDAEILRTTNALYDRLRLTRAYFSAFQPVGDRRGLDLPPTPLIREHRLYQADFLLRRYGFKLDDIPLEHDGNLVLETDPKKLWAEMHPEMFPVEINRAPRAALLRVPGIGPKSARRIIKMRRTQKFRSLEELKATGAVVRWAAPYVTVNGKLGRRGPRLKQLSLWQALRRDRAKLTIPSSF